MRRTHTSTRPTPPRLSAAQQAAADRHGRLYRSLQSTPSEDWRHRVALTVDYLRSELAKLERLDPRAAQEIAARMADALTEGGAEAADIAVAMRH